MSKRYIKPMGPVAKFFRECNTTLWQVAKALKTTVQSVAAWMRGHRYRLGRDKQLLLIDHITRTSNKRWTLRKLEAVRNAISRNYQENLV